MEKQGQTESVAKQPGARVAQPTPETPELAGKYITDLLSQAENAYTMYRQAQREVARGYKKQEQDMEKAFKIAQREANEACERALQKAMKDRDQAERRADEACRKAVDNAHEEYSRSVAEVLKARDKTIEQAWEKSTEGREQAWNLFQGDKPAT